MFIDKWWGQFIGGSDDSLLLLDFLASKNEEELLLKDIMDEINLTEVLKEGNWEEGNVSWKANENFEPEFDLVADVVVDLAAITLESLITKEVAFKTLDKYSQKDGCFSIKTDKESLGLLIQGLEQFIHSAPHYSGLGELMDQNDLSILISHCEEVNKELKNVL